MMNWVVVGVLAVSGGVMARTDLRTHTIPYRVVVPTFMVIGVLEALDGHLLSSLIAASIVFLVGYLLWWISPHFGGGDHRYWTVLGLALGVSGAAFAFALAGSAALLWGLLSGTWRRHGRHTEIAFAPWLAGASMVVAIAQLVYH